MAEDFAAVIEQLASPGVDGRHSRLVSAKAQNSQRIDKVPPVVFQRFVDGRSVIRLCAQFRAPDRTVEKAVNNYRIVPMAKDDVPLDLMERQAGVVYSKDLLFPQFIGVGPFLSWSDLQITSSSIGYASRILSTTAAL